MLTQRVPGYLLEYDYSDSVTTVCSTRVHTWVQRKQAAAQHAKREGMHFEGTRVPTRAWPWQACVLREYVSEYNRNNPNDEPDPDRNRPNRNQLAGAQLALATLELPPLIMSLMLSTLNVSLYSRTACRWGRTRTAQNCYRTATVQCRVSEHDIFVFRFFKKLKKCYSRRALYVWIQFSIAMIVFPIRQFAAWVLTLIDHSYTWA